MLFPLLQQGICDSEERVIGKTICCVASLVEQGEWKHSFLVKSPFWLFVFFCFLFFVNAGLLHTNYIYDLVEDIFPLLSHPNFWIITSIIHFVRTLYKHMEPVAFRCQIQPLLNEHLPVEPGYRFLSASVYQPLLRTIYDQIYYFRDHNVVVEFFNILQARKQQPTSNLSSNNYLFQLLRSDFQANPQIENKLLAMSKQIIKIHQNRRNFAMSDKGGEMDIIIFKDYETSMFQARELPLIYRPNKNRRVRLSMDTTLVGSSSSGASSSDGKGNEFGAYSAEWQQMFGWRMGTDSENGHILIEADINTGVLTKANLGESPETTALSLNDQRYLTRKANIQYASHCPPVSQEVRVLLAKRQEDLIEDPAIPPPPLNEVFEPRGFLLCNITEHCDSVNQLVPYGLDMFLSCCSDGTLKLWSLANLNELVFMRSSFTFTVKTQANGADGKGMQFLGMVLCEDYLISHTEDCVYVFQIIESKIHFVCSFGVGNCLAEAGPTQVYITSLTSLCPNQFALSLSNSIVYGFDVRQIHSENFFVPSFKLDMPVNQRVITSIDGDECILFAGTSNGYIAGFDLRFALKTNKMFDLANRSKITKIKYAEDGLYSTSLGTFDVTLWNCEMSQQSNVLESGNPAIKDMTFHTTRGLLPISPGHLITAGTDQRIRCWNTVKIHESYIVSDPKYKVCNFMTSKPGSFRPVAIKPPKTILTSYQPTTRNNGVVTGVREVPDKSGPSGEFANKHSCMLDHQFVNTAHRNAITDLARVNDYLISSDQNGVIKVWRWQWMADPVPSFLFCWSVVFYLFFWFVQLKRNVLYNE